MVENSIPFRDMRHTLYTVVFEAQTLLAMEGFKWPETEYATFLSLCRMGEEVRKNNPTRRQMTVLIVAFLRFYKRLLGSLIPDNPMRIMGEEHLSHLAAPFQKWLDESPTTHEQ